MKIIKIDFLTGTHEEFVDREGLDMNYVTCSTYKAAADYVTKFVYRDKDKIVDHIRLTKGIYGEPVYYVYYKYKEEVS